MRLKTLNLVINKIDLGYLKLNSVCYDLVKHKYFIFYTDINKSVIMHVNHALLLKYCINF